MTKENGNELWVDITDDCAIVDLPDGHYELKRNNSGGCDDIILGYKKDKIMTVFSDIQTMPQFFAGLIGAFGEYHLIRATRLREGEYVYFDRNMSRHRKTSVGSILKEADPESLVYKLAADVERLSKERNE